MSDNEVITPDPWGELRVHTQARVALGRSGVSMPTQEVLGFGYAHALARDAVHLPLDVPLLC
jgi:ethanolamine ammonia-lyase small subunit